MQGATKAHVHPFQRYADTMRWLIVLAVVGCGSPDYALRMTSTYTVGVESGSGTSPLEPLVGQAITVEITFVKPNHGYDSSMPTCKDTNFEQLMPARVATGAMPDLVTTQILDMLPDWIATLEVCNPVSGSSTEIRSDNEAGLAMTVGCHQLPTSLETMDDKGNPAWASADITSGCDVTLYDQLNGRLYNGSNVSLRIDSP
jgi:hypothetical protein